MKTKYNVCIPFFPGFYNSILDSFIDLEIEREVEGDGEPGDKYYRAPKTWEEVDKLANYSMAFHEISRQWLAAFADLTGLNLEMEALISPREYNFTTDRLFADMDQESLDDIATMRGTPEFDKVLMEMFTFRDGFIPSYSNDASDDEWQQPIEEWDHNQLQALLRAWVMREVGSSDELLESIHDRSSVYEAAQHVWDTLPAPSGKPANVVT